jgi:polysaccharide pyruvyl transferase WcaK-like protein
LHFGELFLGEPFMISSISLLGSSSGRNAGDAALISGIMDSLDNEFGTRLLYEIPTIKPEFIWQNYQNRVRPISMLPWAGSIKMLGVPTLASLMRTDLSMIFDAILFDKQLFNPLFNYLSTLSLLLPLAKKRGKKLGCFNVGAGPVTTPRGQAMLRDVCELMDFITVRDEDSLKILRGIGVQNPNLVVTADAAMTVTPSPSQRVDDILASVGMPVGQKADQEILGINISAYLDSWVSPDRTPMGKERFIKIYSEALSKVLKELRVPALYVCTQYHDVAVTRELMAATKSPAHQALVSNRELSHYDIKGVLGRLGLLFGMRLHAVILASSGFTPVIALPHQPKVNHYLRTLGLEDRAMSFDNFTVDGIASHILKAWSERQAIRRQLEARIPAQKEKSLLAAKLVHALHKGESIGSALARIERANLVVGNNGNHANAQPAFPIDAIIGG